MASELRWLRCDGDGGFGASREIGERKRGGFGATVTVAVASVRAERSVREKARWLRVGWHELGERESEVAWGARGGSGWLWVAGGGSGR